MRPARVRLSAQESETPPAVASTGWVDMPIEGCEIAIFHERFSPGATLDDYLWCGTFWRPGSSQLDRYYGTYAITKDGWIAGMLLPPYSRWYRAYKALDALSNIALNLLRCGLFDEYAALWYDALESALASALNTVEEPDDPRYLLDDIVSMPPWDVLERLLKEGR